MALAISDSRRQTGAGRLLDGPGAALDARIPDALAEAAAEAWQQAVQDLAPRAWGPLTTASRRFPGGISLAVSAPVDGLYAATALNEAAWAHAFAAVSGDPLPDADAARADVLSSAERDADPGLVALVAAAADREVGCLWDDEALTLGLGAGSRTWPAGALPALDAVAWDAVHNVPTALVTGTNGKSTTVRMLAAMATQAGHTPGVSSTDYVAVGNEIIESGDFSGPMGARAALRDRRATTGLLEVARGGLLRRGVPLSVADVACVTNVAADHLGEFGVHTVEALAEAKFVVSKALKPGGRLVLSADDERTCAEADRQAEALAARGVARCWTSHDPDNPRLDGAAVAASIVDEAVSVRCNNGEWVSLISVAEMPAAMGGAARHNVSNALAAAATAAALGLPDAAIAAGLRAFRGDATDNPGRANVTTVNGATVVVDYAHNAHGLAALVAFAAHLPATRRLILVSSAGDRPDSDVADIARAARAFDADRTLVADLPDYLRGRAPGEIAELIVRASVEAGADAASIEAFPDPAQAARAALAWAAPGDVLLLIVLSHRAEVAALVTAADSHR